MLRPLFSSTSSLLWFSTTSGLDESVRVFTQLPLAVLRNLRDYVAKSWQNIQICQLFLRPCLPVTVALLEATQTTQIVVSELQLLRPGNGYIRLLKEKISRRDNVISLFRSEV